MDIIKNSDGDFCPICQNGLMSSNRDEFYTCNNCFVLVRKPDHTTNLEKYYKENWNSPLCNLQSTGGTTLSLARQYISLLQKLIRLESLKGLNILDFGAGKGELIEALAEAGASVYAFEPFGNKFLENKRVPIYTNIEQIPNNQIFHGIMSIDVIEHVPDPITSLKEIYKFLKPGGWLYTATPNCQSLNAQITKNKWREAQNPGHLCLFSRKAMKIALEKAGFENIQRLKWTVRYTDRSYKLLLDQFLTSVSLDGELRFLCQKPKQD